MECDDEYPANSSCVKRNLYAYVFINSNQHMSLGSCLTALVAN